MFILHYPLISHRLIPRFTIVRRCSNGYSLIKPPSGIPCNSAYLYRTFFRTDCGSHSSYGRISFS